MAKKKLLVVTSADGWRPGPGVVRPILQFGTVEIPENVKITPLESVDMTSRDDVGNVSRLLDKANQI